MLTLHREREKETNIVKKKTSNRHITQATNRSSRISEEGLKNQPGSSIQATRTANKPLQHHTFSLTEKPLFTTDTLQIQKKEIDKTTNVEKKKERKKEKAALLTLHREMKRS